MCQYIGQSIIDIESTESTNNYASRQVRENEVKEGTVFLAYAQTAGRGQLANRWESEPGKNLTFSVFLRPGFLEISKQFMLSKVFCLGLMAFLTRFVDNVKIKWPNDIYVGDRKICGILIENSVMNGQITQSIVGIGMNINQTEFVSNAPNPVSLKLLTGQDYELAEMILGLVKEIDHFYKKLESGLYDEIDSAFRQQLYQLDEWHRYKDKEHEYLGKIIGVNKIGQLKIQEKQGPLSEYHFKEVAYL